MPMPGIEFLLTSLIVVLIPGTGVLFTLSSALFQGWRAGIYAAFGCTLGILPHLAAGVLGLAALLHTSALAFQVVKFIGVAYLLYLAIGMWRESGRAAPPQQAPAERGLRVALRAFLINILNPKLSIFFLAFLPQFVTAQGEAATAQMTLLGGVFWA